MTAAEHLAAGEQYIDAANTLRADGLPDGQRDCLMFALVHLLAAVAIELGVPPVASTPGGGQ